MSLPHIQSPADLVTSHEQICRGFLEQALQKTEKASPFVTKALALREEIAGIYHIAELAHRDSIRLELLAAAGFSDKAMSHLSKAELEAALEQVLRTIEQKSGSQWRDEIRLYWKQADSFVHYLFGVHWFFSGVF